MRKISDCIVELKTSTLAVAPSLSLCSSGTEGDADSLWSVRFHFLGSTGVSKSNMLRCLSSLINLRPFGVTRKSLGSDENISWCA